LYATDGTRGDKILGLAPDFKFTQQDLTELNGDGNRERGRYGEDYSKPKPPLTGSPEIATEIEEAQQEEIYNEYQAVFGNEDENPSW
tara:strand:- start:1881 stop:2141 length:261 start_codon:yes stop_codon:yes gene_type:complete